MAKRKSLRDQIEESVSSLDKQYNDEFTLDPWTGHIDVLLPPHASGRSRTKLGTLHMNKVPHGYEVVITPSTEFSARRYLLWSILDTLKCTVIHGVSIKHAYANAEYVIGRLIDIARNQRNR